MKIEVRYRNMDDTESVHAFVLDGSTLRAIGERAVLMLDDGVYDTRDEDDPRTTHSWQMVYNGSAFYIEVVACDE